jgi:hypothetical protein
MGVSIVCSGFVAENVSHNVIQLIKRCQVEIELFHTTRYRSGYQSRDRVSMSRTLALVPGYINTALYRVKVMSPQAQQNYVS